MKEPTILFYAILITTCLLMAMAGLYILANFSRLFRKDKIKEMHRHFNSRYLFILNDKLGTKLTSGRTYHDATQAEFGL